MANTVKNKRDWNREKISKQVLRGHYEWCKKEGRDISWYGENKSKQRTHGRGIRTACESIKQR